MKRALLLIVCAVAASGCGQPRLIRETRMMMGTFAEVISNDSRAPGIVFDEIERIERLLSCYRPDSEVSKLNASGRVKAGDDLWFVMGKSLELWKASEGAFDVSVGPLIELWGFRSRKFRVPSDEEIAETMRLVGSQKIIVNETEHVIQLSVPGMKVDLGGIAAGYAVDRAARLVARAGIRSCLINLGGEIYCMGEKGPGRQWTVGIHASVEKLALRDRAVSTSGDYEQFFESGGRRYSHIMDPRAGYPADTGVTSVTVTSADCLTADALSTAVLVLGKQRGIALVARFPSSEAIVTER